MAGQGGRSFCEVPQTPLSDFFGYSGGSADDTRTRGERLGFIFVSPLRVRLRLPVAGQPYLAHMPLRSTTLCPQHTHGQIRKLYLTAISAIGRPFVDQGTSTCSNLWVKYTRVCAYVRMYTSTAYLKFFLKKSRFCSPLAVSQGTPHPFLFWPLFSN